MMEPDLPDKFAELRRRAEALAQAVNPETLSLEDARQLIHELQVHQIELEIQNEELRVAQLELEISRQKYSDLYDFSPVGLLTLDAQGQILEANLTLANLLGVPRNQLITRALSSFIDPGAQDTYHFFRQHLRGSEQAQQCEVTLLPAQASPLFVRLEGIKLAVTIPTYRVAVSDITTQRALDQQTLELEIQRQRMKVLADFIKGTSHDLRTPITSIMTGLYLIGRSSDKEAQLRKIETINEQLMLLNHALEQLQQMAVLDSTSALELQPSRLAQVLHDVIKASQPAMTDKNIQLICQFQESLPLVPLHASHMHQALVNLMRNSIQFTRSNGTIILTTQHEKNEVILEITDNGIGIEADVLPRVFEHFFKADEARGTRTGGVGLGLSMARRIIELHHGRIEVHSTPHITTTFRVRLPLADQRGSLS